MANSGKEIIAQPFSFASLIKEAILRQLRLKSPIQLFIWAKPMRKIIICLKKFYN